MPPPDSGIDNLVTHRIVSIKDGVYVTKGDANAKKDPWSFELPQATQARVQYDVPYVGYAFMALADRETRMLLIGVPRRHHRPDQPRPAPGCAEAPSGRGCLSPPRCRSRG